MSSRTKTLFFVTILAAQPFFIVTAESNNASGSRSHNLFTMASGVLAIGSFLFAAKNFRNRGYTGQQLKQQISELKKIDEGTEKFPAPASPPAFNPGFTKNSSELEAEYRAYDIKYKLGMIGGVAFTATAALGFLSGFYNSGWNKPVK